MKPPVQPPSDDELDALLASKLRRTTPEFELRWRELRSTLTEPAHAPRLRWPRWLLWPGVAVATLAALAFLLVWRAPHSPSAPHAAGNFDELLALDAALSPATPLFNAENRDAILHLPAQKTPSQSP